MWKTFVSEANKIHMLKLKESSNNNLEIYVTNLTNIWYSLVSEESLLQIFKECNESIEATYDIIKTTLISFLNDIEKCIINVSIPNENDCEVVIGSYSEDLKQHIGSKKINYKFILTKLDQEMFKNNITVPLINTVHYLEQQQENLLSLLQKKDRELLEYKMEKGNITRTDLTTEPFDKNRLLEVKNNDKLILNTFSESKTAWESFKNEYGEIESETALSKIQTEPWNSQPRKRKIYNSKTVAKKSSGIIYKNN